MRQLLSLPASLFITIHCVFGQCDNYVVKGSQVFHANEIRTVINTGGDMFWDLNDGRFQVPFRGKDTPSAIFAAAVWIGGFDDVGNLKMAGQTYRRTARQEYLPGPLTHVGTPFYSDCTVWDTIWTVRRHEILSHIDDYEADGVVDRVQRSLFGWPGVGNIYFESINGFELPDYPEGYAPFFDTDMDGIYEPHDGEFPLPDGFPETVIPDQITWHVFNDFRAHEVTSGDPVRAEIQQTCYAFYCGSDPHLNRTIFLDFHIVNRATSIIDSTFFGIWLDPDLGCYTDDYMGSAPEIDAFMVYNMDSVDGQNGHACFNGVNSYLEGPPVLSGQFLNTPMSSFMYYHSGAIDGPPGMMEPQFGAPLQWYRLLTGSWIDGTPLTIGGTGYSVVPGSNETDYAFAGDPNDSTAWSLYSEGLPAFDRRFVASTKLGRLDPGSGAKFSMAFTLHLDPDRDHLGNVTLMYEQVPALRDKWNVHLPQCVQLSQCTNDCIWPGDINHDGIANHEDVPFLGLAHGQQDITRPGVPNWTPQSAENWDMSFLSGLNMKHADADGDGVIEIDRDGEVLEQHYGFTHDDYVGTYECMEGDALIIDGGFEVHNPNAFASRTRIYLNHEVIPELYGLAFSVLYDTTFFDFTVVQSPSDPFEHTTGYLVCVGRGGHLGEESLPYGRIEYAVTRTDHMNQSFSEQTELLMLMFHHNREDLVPGQPDTTYVCIANIRGFLADGTEIPMGSNRAVYIFKEHPTSVEEPTESKVLVYPNPTSGEVSIITTDDLAGAKYTIYDASGAVLTTGVMRSERFTTLLPSGVFTLVIRSGSDSVIERIVVIR